MGRDRDEGRRGRTSAKAWTSKQSSGGSIKRFRLPQNLDLMKIDSPKPRRLDFLSWKVGKGNPHAEPGELHMELTYWVHRIGPDNDKYVCPAKQLGKRCPICEHRAELKMRADADQDLVKSLYPSQRQLWLAIDLDAPDAGPQLIDYSYHHLGKQIEAEMNAADEDEGADYFADLETGLTVRAAFVEEKPYGYKCSSVKFKKRDRQYGYKYADELPCLEDLLIVESYERLKAIYLQTGDEDGDDGDGGDGDDRPAERPESARGRRAEPAPDPDDEPPKAKPNPAKERGLTEGMLVQHRRLGHGCEIVRISGDGTSLTIEDPEGKTHKAIDPADVRPEPNQKPPRRKETEPEPEPEPEKPKGVKGKPPADEGDGWDEEEPKARPTSSGGRDTKTSQKTTSRSDDDWDEPAPPKAKPAKAAAAKPAPKDDDWDDPAPPPAAKPGRAGKPADKKTAPKEDDWDD